MTINTAQIDSIVRQTSEKKFLYPILNLRNEGCYGVSFKACDRTRLEKRTREIHQTQVNINTSIYLE